VRVPAQAQLLKYARCMRAHGLSNFPDPTSSGLSLSGVDPNSRQFQAALKVCCSLLPDRGQGSVQSTRRGPEAVTVAAVAYER
jgi:hypothetical protein